MTDYKPGDAVLVRATIHRLSDDDGWVALRVNQPGSFGQAMMYAAATELLPAPAADDLAATEARIAEVLTRESHEVERFAENAKLRADLAAAEARIAAVNSPAAMAATAKAIHDELCKSETYSDGEPVGCAWYAADGFTECDISGFVPMAEAAVRALTAADSGEAGGE